ncbi:MAG: hypothetical protein CSA22_01890 [Deltaproteobacteria bacterium]|nr:MAG: hypothetical protein CSA22_01890 [Deltaproteobacteria bacterium]
MIVQNGKGYMALYQQVKSELHTQLAVFSDQVAAATAIPGFDDGLCRKWQAAGDRIRNRLDDEIIRVAVVGAIKSGKSTLINALFGGDHLKRGAGVVTSLVTKVRAGDAPKAEIHLKSWDEVNADIRQALVLFPGGLSVDTEGGGFDIRRQADRESLAAAMADLDAEQLISDDTRNINTVYIRCYLAGFAAIGEMIKPEPSCIAYQGDRFGEHRQFVGDDNLAVYVRDVRISLVTDHLPAQMEVADCQGSDSPNPLHLAQVQDYLAETNLIVYVISSRTGVRRADIRFLSMIREMGILDNMLFVVNCDLNEHDGTADLEALIGRIWEDISLIKPDPEIHAFSSLFNLLRAIREQGGDTALLPKDQARLAQWEGDTVFADWSDARTAGFLDALLGVLTGKRFELLLKNHLERLTLLVDAMINRCRLMTDLLARDTESAVTVVSRIRHYQKKLERVKDMVKRTLDGGKAPLHQSLRTETDHLFAPHRELIQAVSGFIKSYAPGLDAYAASVSTEGFNAVLFRLYQDFKQAVDRHITEVVTPQVIRFTRKMETEIQAYFLGIAEPYEGMMIDALNDYCDGLCELGIVQAPTSWEPIQHGELESMKTVAGIALPPIMDLTRYGARVRTETLFRFGIYTLINRIRQVFKKPVTEDRREALRALKDGLKRMKRETEASIRFHFKDYQENLKFTYLFRLADAVSADVWTTLTERFEAHTADLDGISAVIQSHQTDKASIQEQLARYEADCTDMREKLIGLRADVSGAV